jgi:Tfp pilus tip-associated adhesin PilY1
MNNKTGFFMKIILAFILLIFFLGSNFLANKTYASDTSLLTNLNNPNVLIFLDTSGSMMWNEGVEWKSSATSGYDSPESWSGGGNSFAWAPGSNSVFSKIYNAKMAISEIVTDSSFSNLNFAFATFDQIDASQTSGTAGQCIYSNDGSFQNPSNAAYFPYSGSTGTGIPDETGEYYLSGTYNYNNNYPFNSEYCSGNADGSGLYFISYDYSPYLGDVANGTGNSPWTLYVPLTVNGSLTQSTTTTVSSNSNNSTDPYFDPSNIAGPAINYVLWNAKDYGSLKDPAGNYVAGLKAGGGTPTYSMVKEMIKYFTNSLASDSAKACRRNFNIIITDGEANDPSAADTPNELYDLYQNVDTTYPIETFIIGFGYSGGVSGPTYIQQMANAGAGIDPSNYFVSNGSTVSNPLQFQATAGSSTTAYTLPSAAFSTANGVLVGDTVSDDGRQSSDCEANNTSSTGEPSGIYSSAGFDCAVVTGIYPNTDTILLSNPLSNFSGTLTVSGTVYLTFNYSELVNSLTTIFDQIEAQPTSFTSPVVHQVNAQNGNVYYADFKALNQPLWGEGNIFLFKLNSQGQLTGPNGSAVSTGGQIITSDSYWDNGNGAGGELQTESPASRFITTSETNTSTGLNETIPFNISNVSNLETLLGLNSTNYASVCPGSTSESACADDIINFVLNPDSATDNWKLGAIFHSDPVLISPPSYPYSSLSYQSFKSQYAERQMVLVVGANDGMLHGFDAGTWDSSTNSFTDGTGSELFGYIPPDFLDTNGGSSLPKITSWYETSVTQPSIYEFVDSTPSINDTFFGNIFNGTANSVDTSVYPISAGTPVSSWHTVLVGGERDGGTSYYAVDLTNPGNLGNAYPTGLWDFSDASASTAPMGNTWSEPLMTYVCLPNPNYNSTNGGTGVCGNNPNPQSPVAAPEYIQTYTAFAGGGYSSNNTAGQAVYSLYVEPNPVNTGTSAAPNYVNEQELWKFDSSNDSHMTYSIPSAIAPVESSDFILQAFYAGDLGGQMWAFNIPFGESPQGSGNTQNWTGCRVFASNQTTAPLNIFFPPAVSYDSSGNLWLFFGTGNRENLTEVITARDNELIGLNTVGTQGTGECAKSGPYSETNLTNATGTSGIGTLPGSSAGWYINLSQGEKAVGTAQVYDGVVYFVTYTPSATANACGYGTANLYAVYYLNGGGTITTSGGTTTISNTAGAGASQSMAIGSGVPSSPVISNGNLIVTTSTGAVLTQKIPSLPSKLVPTSWFQLP